MRSHITINLSGISPDMMDTIPFAAYFLYALQRLKSIVKISNNSLHEWAGYRFENPFHALISTQICLVHGCTACPAMCAKVAACCNAMPPAAQIVSTHTQPLEPLPFYRYSHLPSIWRLSSQNRWPRYYSAASALMLCSSIHSTILLEKSIWLALRGHWCKDVADYTML